VRVFGCEIIKKEAELEDNNISVKIIVRNETNKAWPNPIRIQSKNIRLK